MSGSCTMRVRGRELILECVECGLWLRISGEGMISDLHEMANGHRCIPGKRWDPPRPFEEQFNLDDDGGEPG